MKQPKTKPDINIEAVDVTKIVISRSLFSSITSSIATYNIPISNEYYKLNLNYIKNIDWLM